MQISGTKTIRSFGLMASLTSLIALMGCQQDSASPASGASGETVKSEAVGQAPEKVGLVTTKDGDLQGVLQKDAAYISYLGVPFAKPPVGSLRWAPPEPIESWEGVRDAGTYGPDCMQVAAKPGAWNYTEDQNYSEDCLYLNVFVPEKARYSGSPLPVMVWFYGGGFFAGGASQDVYRDPTAYTDENVILVIPNYRVGAFGYLAHPDLSAKSESGVSGNYGTMDNIAALEWVQDNIAAFGGNPDNVTVFGESASSIIANVLLSTPSASDLWSKGIAQSGAIWGLTPPMKTLEQAESWGEEFLSARGATTAEEARALPAEAITGLTSEEAVEHQFGFQPIADGQLTPRTTGDTFLLKEQDSKPIIIGWTRDEAAGFFPPIESEEAMMSWFNSQFGATGAELAEAYLERDGQYRDAMIGAASGSIGQGTLVEAAIHSEKSDIWVYRFDHPAPGQDYAVHGVDVSYTFGHFPDGVNWTDADRKLSEDLVSYWVSFAKSGEPDAFGLPEWPKYVPENPEILYFDTPVRVGEIENYGRLMKTIKTENYSRDPALKALQE